MIRSTKALAALAILPWLGGCTASDAGTTNVKYDPASVDSKAGAARTDLPPDAKAKMEAAMKGGAVRR